MKQNNDSRGRARGRGWHVPMAGTRLTAVVSVALVLLLGALVASLWIAGRSAARELRETMGFVVTMSDGASDADVSALKQRFIAAPYVSSFVYVPASEVLARWQAMLGDDEQVMDITGGVNPFAPEFEVRVREAYASADSLELIAMPLRRMAGVGEVRVHSEVVARVNDMVAMTGLVLGGVAAVLLIISYVLISNTVRLTIYARRFTIYTMRLVGATGGFIRRPIVGANVVAGIVAALIATAVYAAGLWWAGDVEPSVTGLISWADAGWVIGAMLVAGVVICGVAALLATNKYLRSTREKLYR